MKSFTTTLEPSPPTAFYARAFEDPVLTGIRGVGSWTAQWLLIRGLGRTDAFPHLDLALRRALAALVKDDRLLNPQEALIYSRRWSPFRSYVTAYLFGALRSGRFAEL